MRRGFTMLELMLAVLILSIMTIVSVWTFRSIVRNWELATEMADNMQRVDYALAQVTSALRSAYFPTGGNTKDSDGFMLLGDEDDTNDPEETDSITWTKLGPAIVGRNSRFAKSPHRITLKIRKEGELGDDDPGGLVADVISKDLREDDFDEEEEENWDRYVLCENVQGFNCRVLDKEQPFKDDMANWVDQWDTSNCIPRRVQLTFWMKPLDDDKDPYPIVRVVEIPLWDISQNPVTATSDDRGRGRGGRNSGGGRGAGGGQSGGGPGGGGPGGGGPGGGGPGGGGMRGGGQGGGPGGGGRGGGGNSMMRGGGMQGGGRGGMGGGGRGGGMGGGGMPGGGMGGGMPGGGM